MALPEPAPKPRNVVTHSHGCHRQRAGLRSGSCWPIPLPPRLPRLRLQRLLRSLRTRTDCRLFPWRMFPPLAWKKPAVPALLATPFLRHSRKGRLGVAIYAYRDPRLGVVLAFHAIASCRLRYAEYAGCGPRCGEICAIYTLARWRVGSDLQSRPRLQSMQTKCRGWPRRWLEAAVADKPKLPELRVLRVEHCLIRREGVDRRQLWNHGGVNRQRTAGRDRSALQPQPGADAGHGTRAHCRAGPRTTVPLQHLICGAESSAGPGFSVPLVPPPAQT